MSVRDHPVRPSRPPAAGWWVPLLALAAVRAAVPLVALAASGSDLPGLPPYSYAPLTGDSFGFYAAAREFLATFGRIDKAIALALLAASLSAGWASLQLWRHGRRWHGVVGLAAVLALVLASVVERMATTGAAVFGWSLLWSVPMLPYRAAGLPLDPDIAFAFGLSLSLAANAVAIVATAYIGLFATGRRSVGIAAAAAFALWPLFTRLIAGPSAWENGQWDVDVGLALYTEPLSTALVAVALALALSPRLDELRLALAGMALGFATLTKLSNGLVAASVALVVAAWLGPRRAVPLVAGGLVFLPLLAVYWPKGYTALAYVPAWSPEFVGRNWSDSLIFAPEVLVGLLLPAVVGTVELRGCEALALLWGAIVVTAGLYSFYEVTWLHPRFLYVALPPLLVLAAAGVVSIVCRGRSLPRRRPHRAPPACG
jgi:hypothetical protein